MNKYLDPKYLFEHIAVVISPSSFSNLTVFKDSAIEMKMYFRDGKPDIYQYIEHAVQFNFKNFAIYFNKNKWKILYRDTPSVMKHEADSLIEILESIKCQL